MSVEIKTIYHLDPCGDALTIRTLFCKESVATNRASRNPLIETSFNALLDKIAQDAFNEGLNHGKKSK